MPFCTSAAYKGPLSEVYAYKNTYRREVPAFSSNWACLRTPVAVRRRSASDHHQQAASDPKGRATAAHL